MTVLGGRVPHVSRVKPASSVYLSVQYSTSANSSVSPPLGQGLAESMKDML